MSCKCAKTPTYHFLWSDGTNTWRTCGYCQAKIEEEPKKPRPISKGDVICDKDGSAFGQVADLDLFLKSYRGSKDLQHQDGSPILWPEEKPPPSAAPWRAWRDVLSRPGECACGIPKARCEYHKEVA